MNGITKDMFLGAKQNQRDEYFWDAFQTINEKLEQLCEQPETCRQNFDERYVTKKEVKWWKRLLIAFCVGAGYYGFKESMTFFKLFG